MFFIAVLPPPDIQQEVTAFKQLVAESWGPRHAFKSPPHLTLQPPFQWLDEERPRLEACLQRLAKEQSPFSMELRNFGAFAPRVVFVKPVPSPPLEELFHQLTNAMARDLNFVDPRNNRPFHPHMTIAHRDVDPQQFAAIWQHFREQRYERSFRVEAFALMELVKGKWEVGREFRF